MLVEYSGPGGAGGATEAGISKALGRAADTPVITAPLRHFQASHVQRLTRRSWTYSKLAAELAFGPMSGGWHHDR